MAYVKKPVVNPMAAPQQGGGGSALISTGGAQTAGAGGGSAPAGGGGYVNLQDYLKLNQGGAQQMADKVGSFVGGEGKGVTDALGQAQSDFESQRLAGMGTNLTNGSEFNFANQYPTAAGWIHGAPKDTGLTDEQLAAYRKQAGQTYAGPIGLAGLDDLSTKATKAADDAQMAGTFGGLAGSAGAPGLISQVYGGRNTSQGGSNLDAFLAGSTGKLGGLAEKYGKLGDALNAARDSATNEALGSALETQRRADVAQRLVEAEEQRRKRQRYAPHVRAPGTQMGLPVGRSPAKNPPGSTPGPRWGF